MKTSFFFGAIVLLFFSCNKPQEELPAILEITMSNKEVYQNTFGADGIQEVLHIAYQAEHQKSSIVTTPDVNTYYSYIYTPDPAFVGTDFVEIHKKIMRGDEEPTITTAKYQIILTITE